MGSKLAETLNEARWAYERRAERMTYQAIADLTGADRAAGGLGKSIGLKAIRRRVREYAETLAVVVDDETRDEQRARELEDLDNQQRAFVALLGRVDEAASLQRAFAMNTSLDTLRESRPDLLVLRDERVIMRALENLRTVGESRRRLMGTDAPTKIEATVDVADDRAIKAELNSSLLSLGGVLPVADDSGDYYFEARTPQMLIDALPKAIRKRAKRLGAH